MVTAESWPSFLYPNAQANLDDVEHGIFQSAILVKVHWPNLTLNQPLNDTKNSQAFKFIFTSPTSAQYITSENDLQNPEAQPSKRAKHQKAPTRGNVAKVLGMRSVSPRAIAYVAVQVPNFCQPYYSTDDSHDDSYASRFRVLHHGMTMTDHSIILLFTTTSWTFLKRHQDLLRMHVLKH